MSVRKVNLTEMQNNSMRDLNVLFNTSEADTLAEKGLVQEKQSEAADQPGPPGAEHHGSHR